MAQKSVVLGGIPQAEFLIQIRAHQATLIVEVDQIGIGSGLEQGDGALPCPQIVQKGAITLFVAQLCEGHAPFFLASATHDHVTRAFGKPQ